MLFENIKMALAALISNKMRSFLTMLGIIIGIGSVIATASIGDTVRKMFTDIYANVGMSGAFLVLNIDNPKESDFFSIDDINRLKEAFLGKLVYVDARDATNGEITTKLTTQKITLTGIDYNYIDMQRAMSIKHGRFLKEKDILEESTNCIIEDKVAQKLYNTENAVGRTFSMNLNGDFTEFTIVGVYTQNISALQKVLQGFQSNSEVFVPWSLYKANHEYIAVLAYYFDPTFNIEEVGKLNKELLSYVAKIKKSNINNYSLYTVQEQMGQVDGFLAGVAIAIGGIAAISLLVGGIGIMNIMLVSVTERTREIGIRKALGATTKDILTQFLIEAAILSAIGGLIGVILAIVLVFSVGTLINVPVVIKPSIIFIAVGFSAIVGVFFGIFPAKKAANNDPIIALRYE